MDKSRQDNLGIAKSLRKVEKQMESTCRAVDAAIGRTQVPVVYERKPFDRHDPVAEWENILIEQNLLSRETDSVWALAEQRALSVLGKWTELLHRINEYEPR